MPYRLNKGVYAVRCRHPHCTFNAQLEIVDTIMGMTEADVGTEARKMAKDMAHVKHDSLHGRHHTLHKPEIRMVSGTIQLAGAAAAPGSHHPVDFYEREFMKGDLILKKGEGAEAVCEVLRGVAYPIRNRHHKYALGDCFGVAALLPNHNRMTDVVAGADRTRIAFYALPELNKRNPRKASQLLTRVIEDTLEVIEELEPHAKLGTS
jgi:hypothetical protein